MQAWIAICIGACAGALLRWQLSVWGNGLAALPLGTLGANWLGGYLIGICIGVFEAMPELDPQWRLLLVTGFLGALTTFSTFSAEGGRHRRPAPDGLFGPDLAGPEDRGLVVALNPSKLEP